jgi:lipopolysaccharide/colanic/teichoic acid biosynthesis glycosyltransferase
MMRPAPIPYDRVKRLIDVVISALALVVLSPLMLLIALLVLATLGWPVLFGQPRTGRTRRVFELIKFRTMRPPAQGTAAPDSDGDRLTRLGRWLRATSLDELPTLWNVLRGDMSLVGPRPLLVTYLDRYTPEQARRHEVNPGITGLAQVRGRNAISWDDKFAHDVSYVDNRGLTLDLRIMAETVRTVVRRQGINTPGVPTAAEFRPAPDPRRSGRWRLRSRWSRSDAT